MPLPDARGRLAILRVHVRRLHVAGDVDLGLVASACVDFSGAELRAVAVRAASRHTVSARVRVRWLHYRRTPCVHTLHRTRPRLLPCGRAPQPSRGRALRGPSPKWPRRGAQRSLLRGSCSPEVSRRSERRGAPRWLALRWLLRIALPCLDDDYSLLLNCTYRVLYRCLEIGRASGGQRRAPIFWRGATSTGAALSAE